VYNNTPFYDLMKQAKEPILPCVKSGPSKTGQKAKKNKVKKN